jgi:hypothetical protein
MHYDVTRESIDAMIKAPGEVMGGVFKIDEKYILERGGSEKLKKVEEELADMGHAFKYKDIKKKEYYSWGRRALSLLAISRVFNMNKEGVEEMGRKSFKKSFITRFFIRRFFSIESIFKKMEDAWREEHTIGRIEIIEVDQERRKAVIRLYNINFHPIFCDYLCGYFSAIAKIIEGENVYCREEKCFFKGESFFHEFLLTW